MSLSPCWDLNLEGDFLLYGPLEEVRRNNLKQSHDWELRNKDDVLVFNAISCIPHGSRFSKDNLLNFNIYSTNSVCADSHAEMTDSGSIDLGKSWVNL